jgi:hypothetical protein
MGVTCTVGASANRRSVFVCGGGLSGVAAHSCMRLLRICMCEQEWRGVCMFDERSWMLHRQQQGVCAFLKTCMHACRVGADQLGV